MAAAYATRFISAITSHELFKAIELNTTRYWDSLLYMDAARFGGVICEDPSAIEPPPGAAITNEWNIAVFLPDAFQLYFRSIVEKFLLELYKPKMRPHKRVEDGSTGDTQPHARWFEPTATGRRKVKGNTAIETSILKNLMRIMFSIVQRSSMR
ncbi:DNA polymerase epsilon catalytic subunit, partial [Tulasnella sp. 332]